MAAVMISAHVQTRNGYSGATRAVFPPRFSVRVEHAAYCITSMTWTILNLLTWPQYEFPWELVRLLEMVKRFMGKDQTLD